MNDTSDIQLLRDYAERRDESAFREIVRRHTDFVYSAALRQLESPDLAADAAQTVFVDLARKADAIARGGARNPSASLAGWLHRATRFAALNHWRDARRRHTNERQAMQQLLTDSESSAEWELIRPVLDEALDNLSDEDRDALILRYFKNHNFRDVGLALGISDDAAQKRVSRAVERLREFFSKRNVTIGASGLVVLISAYAVQSAPTALISTISTAALSGAVSASTLVAATKTIAMTTLQKTLVTATVAVIAGTGLYEMHENSKLHDQAQSYEAQQAVLEGQIQELQHERDDATNRLIAIANELTKANSNNLELLKLRNEATALRHGQTAASTPADASSHGKTVSDDGVSLNAVGQVLGMAVVRGDAGAFEKLLAEAKSEFQNFNTNSAGLGDSQRGELSLRTFTPINAAFKIIEDAAAEGNQLALDALTRALETPELRGSAVASIGSLAANGDVAALEILLHPEKYGVLLSSTVPALQPAADNGNQQAIEALAAIAKNQADQPLWLMTANGLAKAAAAGNTVATDALISMSSSTNRNIQSTVIAVLQTAAANQNARAAEALRTIVSNN